MKDNNEDKRKMKIANEKGVLVAVLVVVFLVGSCGILVKALLFDNNINQSVGQVVQHNEKSQQESEKEKQKKEIKNNIILANKNHPLGADYKPKDLVTPNIRFTSSGNDMVRYVTKDTAKALEDMFAAAKKDGITLLGVSGFRDYNYQVQVFNQSVRDYGLRHSEEYVAKPGSSEHQTGQAIDVLSTEYGSLDEGFENTKAFKWLQEYMADYGFILRYPKGKESITGYNYEAWHIRYVGVEAAKEIASKNITLEEYLGKE